MLNSIRNCIYQRRKGLATAVGFFGGLYLAGRYILERLEEIREQVVQEKTARENLRRRFQQNQQDCTYTILALVPTLGDRILEEMDVESVTFTLQMQSKAAKSRLEGSAMSDINSSSLSLDTEQPSVISSLQPSSSNLGREEHKAQTSSSSIVGETAERWVDHFTQQISDSATSEQFAHAARQDSGSPASSNARLSDSITSAGTSFISGSDGERSGVMIESLRSTQSESSESQAGAATRTHVMTTQSKAELWREVKILTFTRTLTILYSTTLLSLLTHIQLNLLGRYKYVQSILDMEREEKLRERQAFGTSISSLFGGVESLEGAFEGLENDSMSHPLGLFGAGGTGGTERKYLTLSWWLIHVGWREIGDRVRRAVEDIFDGVSLKANLGIEDLERLFTEVRRRIEFDDAPSASIRLEDGGSSRTPSSGRRISFLSSLVPPTSESLKDVLVQGGLPHHLTNLEDTAFIELIDETRAFVSSADFGRVLEVCLDHATELLFDGLRRTLFTDIVAGEDTSSGQKVRLAGLLPGVARWSHAAIHGTPNDLVEGLADVRELAGFSAIIYSSYEGSFRELSYRDV